VSMLIYELDTVLGLEPKADGLAGTVTTPCVNMENLDDLAALVALGAGGTGTTTITVEACSASDGSGNEAIPFKCKTSLSSDAFAAVEDVAAAGKLTAAGTNDQYMVGVRAAQLPIGKPWVRVKCVEGVDNPINAAIILLGKPKHQKDPLPSIMS
jgi:hypothetical protein